MKHYQWSYSVISIALLIVCLVGVNVVGSFLPLRVDITDDRLYTISEGTKKILDDLEETVTIKYYFSKSNSALPTEFKAYAQRIKELLEEYSYLSSGKIKLEVFDPKPDTEEEEWAEQYGISPIALPNGDHLYLGMIALLLDQEVVIPFFDMRREEFLEYDISQAILTVNNPQSPKIGIISSLNMNGGGPPAMGARRPPSQWAVVAELKKNFDVEMLLPSTEEISDDITLLLLIHPKGFSERLHYAVDQYVLRGGRLVVLVDPSSYFDAQNSPGAQYGMPPNPKSDLPKLLKQWGVTFDAGKLVGDFRYATPINAGGGQVVRYPLWMSLADEAMPSEHPITSQLESLLFVDSGYLKKAKDSSVEFTPILQTSLDSAVIDSMKTRFSKPDQIIRDLRPDKEVKVLAAFIKNQFETAFPEGQPPEEKTEEGKEAQKENVPLKHAHLKKAQEANTILVIADVDFITDSFSVQKLNFLGQTITQPLNDNLNFMLNAVEFISGNDALMSIRSRGRFTRPFTRLIALEQKAQLRFQEEEIALKSKLKEVQDKLRNLEEQKDSKQKRLLTLEQQQEIKEFRVEELKTRKRLREVRKILRQDIESLGNWLLGLNILLIPSLVAFIGIVFYRRRTSSRHNQ
ncbi:MAG: Gldg family protein [SAR324 cluster bacterium]|nr:Gldg family protein [SAR324 cluster bacterium]